MHHVSSMTNSKSQKEKAVAQVLEMVINSYKPREHRELAEWIVDSMKPEVVSGLAADFDEVNEDA